MNLTLKRGCSHTSQNNFYFRTNKERLKRLGHTLSTKSRQYRAKRIKINIIINGIAYLTEVLGGIVMIGLAFLRPMVITNIGTAIWYALIIPSCYLMNSNENKDSIMEHGWTNLARDLYAKKTRKYEPKSINGNIEKSSHSTRDFPSKNLTTCKKCFAPNVTQNDGGIRKNLEAPSESATGMSVNEAKDELRNGLEIYDIETDYKQHL